MHGTMIPIAEATELRPCYGVCCSMHSRCARYAAVDGAQGGEPMATCLTYEGYPEFVELPEECV